MDQSRDKRIMSLVRGCADLTPAERARYLAAECDDDHDLIAEVEAIVADDGSETGIHPSTQRLAKALPDHYRLLDLIGSGGMAEVFLAEDTRLHRKVAIKILNETFRSDPERMLRFTQEARSASALNHPNIITIHDIGESEGVQYIVSEFVDGETLATRLTRGKIPIFEAVEIAIRIASALDCSHRAGIIHRDLKPENIMLRLDGGLKVVDFGLAKGSAVVGHHGKTLEVVTTSPGMILGTPRYMSPEQTRGLPLDGRSDIFSLGIILFEMVTGRTPFPGRTAADTIAAILSTEPRPVASFIKDPPQKFVRIIERSLRKDPEERFRSMAALLSDLEDFKADMTVPGRTITERLEKPRPRYSHLIVAAILGALALLTVGWWYVGGRGHSTLASSGALKNVQITSWSTVSAEAVTAASFSPDGRMIAFGSPRQGASEILAKPTAGGEPIQVTKNGFYNRYPVWSPDGQELAFFSSRGDDQGIWKVAFTGGQESQLVGGVSTTAKPLRWFKNETLLYQEGAAGEIYSLDMKSGRRSRLTDLAAAGVNPRAIAVSADGSSLAVSLKENGTWKVKTKAFDAASFTEIATSNDQINSLAFNPDGHEVYYTGSVDETFQVFVASEGNAPVQISSSNSDLSLQDVSADGSRVLYNTINETSDLWAVNVADGKESVVANDVSEEYWPDVSPDGKSVVYQSVAQADRPYGAAIFIKPISGGSQRQIASDGYYPLWSNDGQWISFLRRSASDISIWKVRPTGADADKVVEAGVKSLGYLSVPYLKTLVSEIAWSSDALSIAYPAKTDGVSNIWIAPLNGGQPRPLTGNKDPKETFSSVVWDPSGRVIAVTSEMSASDTKTYRLSIVNPDGSHPNPVFESQTAFRFLGWTGAELVIAVRADPKDTSQAPALTKLLTVSSLTGATRQIGSIANAYFSNIHLAAGGQTIAYATRSNNVCEIWTLSLTGGNPRKVLAENDPKVLFSSLAWSPDGRLLIYGKQTRTNVLSMLTN